MSRSRPAASCRRKGRRVSQADADSRPRRSLSGYGRERVRPIDESRRRRVQSHIEISLTKRASAASAHPTSKRAKYMAGRSPIIIDAFAAGAAIFALAPGLSTSVQRAAGIGPQDKANVAKSAATEASSDVLPMD